jgi:hypothetical protein
MYYKQYTVQCSEYYIMIHRTVQVPGLVPSSDSVRVEESKHLVLVSLYLVQYTYDIQMNLSTVRVVLVLSISF